MPSPALTRDAYKYFRPQDSASPLIITSPHSGREYPDDFNYDCSLEKLKRLEDHKVDLICDGLWRMGAHVLFARKPRSYIDLSRARDCLNPDDIRGEITSLAFNKDGDNARFLQSRTGLIFMQSRINNFIIYSPDNYPTEEDITHRLKLWDEYHEKLSDIFSQASQKFTQVYHLDMHSCWRHVTRKDGSKKTRPDITISNNLDQTASIDFTQIITKMFADNGLKTQINDPFKGGFIIQHYGSPTERRHSLQIEIARDLYMNETTNEVDQSKLSHIQKTIQSVTQGAVNYALEQNI